MFRAVASSQNLLLIPFFIPHLGCPHQCAFCNQHAITGELKTSPGQLESVVDQYTRWSSGGKQRELSFFGGSFTALDIETMQSFIDAANKLRHAGSIDTLRCSTRPDAINNNIAALLKNNGFSTVELGVQTLSETLLHTMHRGHSTADVFSAVATLKKHALNVVVQFMTGYPEESEDDADITCTLLATLKPDAIRIYPFTPLPHTPISGSLATGKCVMPEIATIIRRSAQLFLAAQKQGIPAIRIGLPETERSSHLYPPHIGQLITAAALEILYCEGERDFNLPKKWESAYNIAKKNCTGTNMSVHYF